MKFLNDGWQEEYFSMRFSLTMIVGAILIHLNSLFFVMMATNSFGNPCSPVMKNIYFPYEYLFDFILYLLSLGHSSSELIYYMSEYYFWVELSGLFFIIFLLVMSLRRGRVFLIFLGLCAFFDQLLPAAFRYFFETYFSDYIGYCSPSLFVTSERIFCLCLFILGITNIIIKITSNYHKNSQIEGK